MERKGLPAATGPLRSRRHKSGEGDPDLDVNQKKPAQQGAGQKQNLVPLRGVEPPTY